MSRLRCNDKNPANFGERLCRTEASRIAGAFLVCAWLIGFWAPWQARATTAAMSIREIRQNRGSQPNAVTVRGVITAFSGWKNSFFLQDSTDAISVDRLDDANVRAGDEVEVTGQSRPGRFAPILLSDSIRVIAHSGLPPARLSSYPELSQGQFDSRLVEVSGVIQAATVREMWGRHVLFLDLHTPEGVISVHVLDYPKANFKHLVDSTVRVTGVCGIIFNNQRQLVGLRLFVSDLSGVVVVTPAPDPVRLPFSALNTLMSFDGPSTTHRVKVTGIVTSRSSGKTFYLQQGGTAVQIESLMAADWVPGMRVNAWGFLGDSSYLISLRNAVVEQLGIERLPDPVHIVAAEAIKNEDGFAEAPYNGLLVQLEGQVVGILPGPEHQLLEIRAGPVRFQAQLGGGEGANKLAIEAGSRVRLTGIYLAEDDENQEPKSFRIALRTPKDIRILNAPYRTSLILLNAILVLILLGSFLIWFSKGRQQRFTLDNASQRMSAMVTMHCRYASRTFAGLAAMIGGLIVTGWTLDIRALQFRAFSSAPMPNAAMAILAAGAALELVNSGNGWLPSFTCTICTVTAMAIGALSLLEYVTPWNFHIDHLLFRNLDGLSNSAGSGRMGMATALCLLLAGCAILLLRYRRSAGFGQIMATMAGVTSLLNLTNWLYGNQARYGTDAHATMAPSMAVGLAILSLAILLSKPDRGVMRTVALSASGGLMARHLLPVALLAPVLLGELQLRGQLAGLYDARFGLALFALSNVVCFGLMIWNSAETLNRLDRSRHEAERSLREREWQLEMVFDQASIGDWTWDAEKDEITAHPIVWKMYGAPGRSGSAPAAWFKSRRHPEDAAATEREFRSAIVQRGTLEREFRVIHPDGTIRWLCCRGVAMYDDSGQVLQANGIYFDITDRKLAEEQVKKSEMLFRQLADAMPQIVWTLRSEGTVDYYNQRWYEYAGTTSKRGWKHVIHPEDLKPCKSVWMESVADGSPFEAKVRLKQASNGKYRWHLVRAVPIRDASGATVRWFGTATDIDDFKRASAELRLLNESLERRVQQRSAQLVNSERRQRLLVEGIQDYAIFMLDTDGRVATWNAGAERIKQYDASEILGKHFSIFYSADAIASGHPQRELDLALQQGLYREEGWRVRKDGSRFWANVLITSIHDAEGALSGFSKVVRDLTEQKDAEQRLISAQKRAEEANLAKSNFLAAMSHEIRTPMNAILGMADLLWETNLNEDQRDYVGRFRRAGASLLALINDILDLSKIESGRFELEAVDFFLLDVVDRAMELMRPRASLKKIDLKMQVMPGLPAAVVGDPTRLQQILNNIIGNAIKFTEAGTVTLAVENHKDNQPGHIQFAVSDTGIGIPAGKLAQVFDDFTQAEDSITRRFGGTGLGLAISRRLVKRMDGDLAVESELGKGSTFTFDVVLTPSCRTVETGNKEISDLIRHRVLVVDNNPTNRLILHETCAGWGMAVDEAANAAEACEQVGKATESRHGFSLVLLDVHMPDANGFDVLQRLRAIDSVLPIIMTSSDWQPGHMTKAKALGAAAYITKPVLKPELLVLFTSVFRENHRHDEHEHSGFAQQAGRNKIGENRMRILLAEDSEDNRFLLAAYLKNRHYDLTFIENGKEALDTFANREFDLVLMDVQMPVMDGLTAARAIRALERERAAKPTPIVALTANALVEDVERSRAAGCTSHLSKPISKEKLIAVIEGFRGVLPDAMDHPQDTPTEKATYGIKIPEGFEQLSRNYINARKREISHMRELAPGQGMKELRVFGHNMKGTGTSFGFPELTKLGAAIEEAAKTSNTSQLANHLLKVSEYVECASQVLA
ncbi:MAG TPA: response regulator [Bryobacteraceae bacterium]|jgi:PAS domain S-box-containing protein|nr:response regulator [Bryobacteraceae bacterium]